MTEEHNDDESTDTICPYCRSDYSDPNGVASDDYMWHGHIVNDCPDPDRMVWAYLNASAQEQIEVWS